MARGATIGITHYTIFKCIWFFRLLDLAHSRYIYSVANLIALSIIPSASAPTELTSSITDITMHLLLFLSPPLVLMLLFLSYSTLLQFSSTLQTIANMHTVKIGGGSEEPCRVMDKYYSFLYLFPVRSYPEIPQSQVVVYVLH